MRDPVFLAHALAAAWLVLCAHSVVTLIRGYKRSAEYACKGLMQASAELRAEQNRSRELAKGRVVLVFQCSQCKREEKSSTNSPTF